LSEFTAVLDTVWFNFSLAVCSDCVQCWLLTSGSSVHIVVPPGDRRWNWVPCTAR